MLSGRWTDTQHTQDAVNRQLNQPTKARGQAHLPHTHTQREGKGAGRTRDADEDGRADVALLHRVLPRLDAHLFVFGCGVMW